MLFCQEAFAAGGFDTVCAPVWFNGVMKKLLAKYRELAVAGAAVVLAVMVAGGVVAYQGAMGGMAEVEHVSSSKKADAKPKVTASPSPSVASETPAASPAATPTPQTAPSVAPKTSVAPKPAGSKSPTPTTTPPQPAPFAITYVRVDGATWYCAGKQLYLTANGITNASNSSGGSFAWMVESSTSAPLSTPVPSAFPAGRQFLVSSNIDRNGPWFSGNVTAGQSIRYRVTSPNNIASAWYTVPASATCPQ